MISPITTHVKDGLNHLLEQYKGRPGVVALFTAILKQIQAAEDGVYNVAPLSLIWDGSQTPAFGQQLDGIGEIVGINRNGLPDDEYILFIFGKIAENFSQSTVQDIGTVASYLFQPDILYMTPIYPAGWFVEPIGIAIPERLWALAAQLVAAALGAGINIVFAGSAETDVFRFDGPGVVGAVNGFGDLNDPSVGGKFLGLIQ